MISIGGIWNTLLIVAAAFVLVVSATPLARRLAIRMEFFDRPAARSDHSRPIPLLGGPALWIGVVGSLLIFGARAGSVGIVAILVGATWISLVGVWDDRRTLRVRSKFFGQVVALMVLLAGGVQVLWIAPAWVNLPVTAFWVLGITNAFNLLDNMDGLSGGIGAVAAGAFLVLAILNGQPHVAVVAAAVCGACLGFLIYNFYPARIFMGDSGSLFLGFLLAACGIEIGFPRNVPWVTWMVPVLVMGVPILDTTLVVVSRLRRGLNPFTSPGRDHLSHRLCEAGLSRRQAVLTLYLVALLLAAAAVVVSLSDARVAYAIGGVVGLGGSVALVWFEARSSPRTSR